jgi:hypothetical protein
VLCADGRRIPAGYRYPSSALKEFLVGCAARVGHPPAVGEYTRWRDGELERGLRGGGQLRAIPSRYVFLSRFRSWGGALRAAGLIEQRWDRGTARAWTSEQMRQAMLGAHQAIGDPLTKHAYETWRRGRAAADRAERFPAAETIASRHGGWKNAHQELLGVPRNW